MNFFFFLGVIKGIQIQLKKKTGMDIKEVDFSAR